MLTATLACQTGSSMGPTTASAAAQPQRFVRLSGAKRRARLTEKANVVATAATAASHGNSVTLMAQPLTADAGTGGAVELIPLVI